MLSALTRLNHDSLIRWSLMNTSDTNLGEQVALFGEFHNAWNCRANLRKNWNKVGENDFIRNRSIHLCGVPTHEWNGKDQ
jgi:hypothetical protein